MWLTTWPSLTGPAYKEHHSEAAAEEHAAALVRQGKASVAVCFEMDQPEGAA